MAELLTLEDLNSFNGPPPLTNLSAPVLTKLTNASRKLLAPYIIDHKLYDHVYVTSDVHADLNRLIMILENANLVNASPEPFEDDSSNLIQKILNTDWLPERTLLVIVGDLVDGKRGKKNYNDSIRTLASIPDRKGNVELLLHAYIYNLRIKAQQRNSEVRFTIGNHDFLTVIKETVSEDNKHFYKLYVHDKAMEFFGSRKGRRDCLIPFYDCCPYLFLTIDDEVAFAHGGLDHSGYGASMNLTPMAIRIQEKIDSVGKISTLDDNSLDLLTTETSLLWTRSYAMNPRLCGTVDRNYKLVVVGHCQMSSGSTTERSYGESSDTTRRLLERSSYTKHSCGGLQGCVVVGCKKPDGPHLAWVDIGMSRAFNPVNTTFEEEKARRSEILYLTHRPDGPDSRFYNLVVRKDTGPKKVDEIVWPNQAQDALDEVEDEQREIQRRKEEDERIQATRAAAKLRGKYGDDYELHDVEKNKDGKWVATFCSVLAGTCILAAVGLFKIARGGRTKRIKRIKRIKNNGRKTRRH